MVCFSGKGTRHFKMDPWCGVQLAVQRCIKGGCVHVSYIQLNALCGLRCVTAERLVSVCERCRKALRTAVNRTSVSVLSRRETQSVGFEGDEKDHRTCGNNAVFFVRQEAIGRSGPCSQQSRLKQSTFLLCDNGVQFTASGDGGRWLSAFQPLVTHRRVMTAFSELLLAERHMTCVGCHTGSDTYHSCRFALTNSSDFSCVQTCLVPWASRGLSRKCRVAVAVAS